MEPIQCDRYKMGGEDFDCGEVNQFAWRSKENIPACGWQVTLRRPITNVSFSHIPSLSGLSRERENRAQI